MACVHHYIIAPSEDRGPAEGVCKHCGARKVHANTLTVPMIGNGFENIAIARHAARLPLPFRAEPEPSRGPRLARAEPPPLFGDAA